VLYGFNSSRTTQLQVVKRSALVGELGGAARQPPETINVTGGDAISPSARHDDDENVTLGGAAEITSRRDPWVVMPTVDRVHGSRQRRRIGIRQASGYPTRKARRQGQHRGALTVCGHDMGAHRSVRVHYDSTASPERRCPRRRTTRRNRHGPPPRPVNMLRKGENKPHGTRAST